MKNKYEIRGEVSAVFIYSKGKEYEVLIDTDDLEKVLSAEGKWTLGTGNYVISKNITPPRKCLRIHRYVTDAPHGYEVDHINHNRLDNRKENLRVVTKSVNLQNLKGSKSHNKSTGIRNVYFNKLLDKYQVKLQVNKKAVHGGFYETIEEAAEVAKKLRAILMEGSKEHKNLDITEKIHDILPTHKAIATNKGTGIKNVYYEPNVRGSKKFKVMINNKFYGRFRTLEEADSVARSIREKTSNIGTHTLD